MGKPIIKILMIICLLWHTQTVYAQDKREISGSIIDKESNEPLIGATIYSILESQGVITGLDGTFTLVVNRRSNYELVVSYTGYASVEEEISGRSSINIVMSEEASVLD